MPPPNTSASTPLGNEATSLIGDRLPSNSATIAAKPSYGPQLQRSLDILTYAYILSTYFSDSYSILLIPRIMIQLAFLTPKPPPVPQLLPPFLRKPLMISILGLNLFAIFIHIIYPPQSTPFSLKYPIFPYDPTEAYGGYFNLPDAARSMLHGGWTSIEFIGEYPASVLRLIAYDLLVLFLQLALFSLDILPFVNNHGDGVDTIEQIENDNCVPVGMRQQMSPGELEIAIENNPYLRAPNSIHLTSPVSSGSTSVSSSSDFTTPAPNHNNNREDDIVASVLSQNVNSPEARYSGRSIAGDIRLAHSILTSLTSPTTLPNSSTLTTTATGTRTTATQSSNTVRNETNSTTATTTTTTPPATIMNPLNNEFIQRAMSSLNFNA